MNENAQYAQGRIYNLAVELLASGLSARAIARGAGVSKETAYRAMNGDGIQAFNFFKLEYFVMNLNRDNNEHTSNR